MLMVASNNEYIWFLLSAFVDKACDISYPSYGGVRS